MNILSVERVTNSAASGSDVDQPAAGDGFDRLFSASIESETESSGRSTELENEGRFSSASSREGRRDARDQEDGRLDREETSTDGPQEVNDVSRQTRSGQVSEDGGGAQGTAAERNEEEAGGEEQQRAALLAEGERERRIAEQALRGASAEAAREDPDAEISQERAEAGGEVRPGTAAERRSELAVSAASTAGDAENAGSASSAERADDVAGTEGPALRAVRDASSEQIEGGAAQNSSVPLDDENESSRNLASTNNVSANSVLADRDRVALAGSDASAGRQGAERTREASEFVHRGGLAEAEGEESGRVGVASAPGENSSGAEEGREDGRQAPRGSEDLSQGSLADASVAGVATSDAARAAQTSASLESLAGTQSIEGASSAAPVQGPILPQTATSDLPPGTPIPPQASDAVAIQAEWLAARGGGSVRLLLHPPELGEIAVRVSLRGGAVNVVLVAQEASARALVEGQAERLSEAFSNRDLRLENFEVRRGDPGSVDEDGRGNFLGADAQDAQEQGARDGKSADRGEGKEGDLRGEGHRGEADSIAPEALPRIITVAAASGVDLRI